MHPSDYERYAPKRDSDPDDGITEATNLGRYIATKGEMGACPDWYAAMQAAKYLNCTPWELMEQSIYWEDKAFVAMDGEHQAQETLKAQGR